MTDKPDPGDGRQAVVPGIRADFWFGLGLTTLGLAAAVESWRMPRLTELNVHPMTAPGLVPGLLGIVIFGLGAVLFIRAARAGGWRVSGLSPTNPAAPTNPTALTNPAAAKSDTDSSGTTEGIGNQTGRFFIALALCVGYAAGLVGLLPFWAATFLFIFAFIAIFEWQGGRTGPGHIRAMFLTALQAVIVAGVVTYIFESVFLVRLP